MNTIAKCLTTLGSLAITFSAAAQQPVLQRGYDYGVSGATLTETTLNTSNVNVSQFGLVFKLPVDDVIYAQPLYVPNVAIPGQGNHNVLYVATMSDTLYAFDADTGGTPLWSANFASNVGSTPIPIAQFEFGGNQNIVGNLGILSTPVIDPTSNTLYLVAGTLENGSMVYRLHAVDITTGAEPLGSDVLISASYGGLSFDARYQLQRASLTLSDNQVVFGFSAVEIENPNTYVGWVLAYSKFTLQQSGSLATVTVGSRGAGVWQSGRPPVVDGSGYVYVFTGNGWWGSGYDGVHDFSESALKLDPANGLSLVDWFTPGDWSYLDTNDLDLSSSGPLLIPGTSLLAGGGKEGVLYVLNTAYLGKYNANDSQIVQKEDITGGGEFRGGPVFWQRSAANGGPLLYDWGAWDSVKAYAFNGSAFGTSPSAQGISNPNWPGGVLTLSANGDQPGSGVLWATVVTSGDAQDNPPAPGALYAFDAGNVSTTLWDSTLNASRDGYGNFAKIVPPTVANGKVYVGTWSNQVAVYGLLLSYKAAPTSLTFGTQIVNVASSPMTITVTNTGAVSLPISSITLSSASASSFSQTNTCGGSVAVGAKCTVSVVFNPTATGPASSTLSVNAGGGGGTQTVALSGTGAVVSYTALPGSLAFGSQATNTASAPMWVTVTNTGTLPLPITGISLSTPSPNPFSQTNTCARSVAVGSSCTVSVVFNPVSAGSTTATLSINAGASTSTINLSGTGNLAVALTASAQSVTAGVPVTLTWSSTLGATCTASGGGNGDGWNGAIAASGSQPVSEASAGNYNYTLTCNAPGVANVIATATATVTVPTVTMTATPTAVTVGKSVTLTWVSVTATACVGTGGQSGDGWTGNKSTNNSATVTPNAAGLTTYTITCSSGPNAAQAVAAVTVTSPPSSGGGGGGAFDAISLLSLLTMLGLRQRRALVRRT